MGNTYSDDELAALRRARAAHERLGRWLKRTTSPTGGYSVPELRLISSELQEAAAELSGACNPDPETKR